MYNTHNQLTTGVWNFWNHEEVVQKINHKEAALLKLLCAQLSVTQIIYWKTTTFTKEGQIKLKTVASCVDQDFQWKQKGRFEEDYSGRFFRILFWATVIGWKFSVFSSDITIHTTASWRVSVFNFGLFIFGLNRHLKIADKYCEIFK